MRTGKARDLLQLSHFFNVHNANQTCVRRKITKKEIPNALASAEKTSSVQNEMRGENDA